MTKVVYTTAAGFEPTRECPNGFQVHHLNDLVKQPFILAKTIVRHIHTHRQTDRQTDIQTHYITFIQMT